MDCSTHIGYVIYDCICLALGAGEMRDKITDVDAKVIAAAADPAIIAIKNEVYTISDIASDRAEIASAAFTIVSTLHSTGCLPEVYKIWVATLPTRDAIKFTAKTFKTLVAAFFTDGVAVLGMIIVELATFAHLIPDSIDAMNCCYGE